MVPTIYEQHQYIQRTHHARPGVLNPNHNFLVPLRNYHSYASSNPHYMTKSQPTNAQGAAISSILPAHRPLHGPSNTPKGPTFYRLQHPGSQPLNRRSQPLIRTNCSPGSNQTLSPGGKEKPAGPDRIGSPNARRPRIRTI